MGYEYEYDVTGMKKSPLTWGGYTYTGQKATTKDAGFGFGYTKAEGPVYDGKPALVGEAARRAEMFSNRQAEFDEYFRPEYEKAMALQERSAMDAMQREKAMALQQLGYARSAGSGASGLYDAAQIAMSRGFGQKMGDISRIAEEGVLQAYLGYVMQGDTYDHQKQMAALGHQYNMELAKQNDPGFWDAIGSLAGIGLSIIGTKWAMGGVKTT